jgi:hypothetical protein
MFVMDVGTLQFINLIKEIGIGVPYTKELQDNLNATHQ